MLDSTDFECFELETQGAKEGFDRGLKLELASTTNGLETTASINKQIEIFPMNFSLLFIIYPLPIDRSLKPNKMTSSIQRKALTFWTNEVLKRFQAFLLGCSRRFTLFSNYFPAQRLNAGKAAWA